MTETLPYADEIRYWKTGQSSPDAWIDKTVGVIKEMGGLNISEAFGSSRGRAAFCLAFEIGGERFRVVWPVLQTRRPDDERAARVQAATLLYHDCKAKAIAASVLGTRTAFFHALMLPDGRTLAEVANPLLAESIPAGLLGQRGDE
jgi:hypothetical protein